MGTTLIFLALLLCIILLFFAYRKIYKHQEKIMELEDVLRSYKKVLLQKTTSSPDDLELYDGLKGFEEQYFVTKVKHEKEGKKLFDEAVRKAKHSFYIWELNDILRCLDSLSKIRNIDYIEFYGLYQNLSTSDNDFALALRKMFSKEMEVHKNDKREIFETDCQKLLEECERTHLLEYLKA